MNRFVPALLAAALISLATSPAFAASKEEIDAEVKQALGELYKQSSAAKELSASAKAILVFPKVVKGGVGIGGEYGEGALLVGGKTAGYYNTASGSIGFQLGLQQKSQVIMFMTQKELDKFQKQHHDGWKAGVDGSVALATLGAGGAARHRNREEADHRVHLFQQGTDVQPDLRRLEDHQARQIVGQAGFRPPPPRDRRSAPSAWRFRR